MKQFYTLFFIWLYVFYGAFGQGVIHKDSKGLNMYLHATKAIQNNDYTNALLYLDKAIHLDSTSAPYFFERGLCYIHFKDGDRALFDFKYALKLKPNDIETYNMIGHVYAHFFNKTNEAIAAYDKAYSLEKDVIKKFVIKINTISVLDRANQLPKSTTHLADAQKTGITHPLLLYYVAKLHNIDRKYTEAKDKLLKAIRLLEKPTEVVVNHHISIFKEVGKEDQSKYYYELYIAYYQLNQYADAQKLLPKITDSHYQEAVKSMDVDYLFSVAYAHFLVYDLKACEQILTQIVKLDSRHKGANELFVKIAALHTDKSPLIQQYEASLPKMKDEKIKFTMRKELLTMLIERGDYAKAISVAELLLQADPKGHYFLFMKAVALHKLNRSADALQIMHKLVNFRGLDEKEEAEYEFTLGLIAKKLNQIEMAKAAFQNTQYKYFKLAAEQELRTIAYQQQTIR